MAARGAAFGVDGLRQLQRDLKKFGDGVQELKKANAAAGRIISTASAPRAPRRTGRLAASIRPSAAAGGVVVRSTAPYSAVIHWGWPGRGILARPFIVDAAEATQPVWLDQYAQELQTAADRINRRTY